MQKKGKYYTCKKTKESIDALLTENAKNVSNAGTGSMNDIGDENVSIEWAKIEQFIKELDPDFFNIIKQQDDE
tara:strand:- start:9796 stop:10014 length:219 start_codon:yes stop_codon:yes gene_type:complete